jgi:hypothetical protein
MTAKAWPHNESEQLFRAEILRYPPLDAQEGANELKIAPRTFGIIE